MYFEGRDVLLVRDNDHFCSRFIYARNLSDDLALVFVLIDSKRSVIIGKKGKDREAVNNPYKLISRASPDSCSLV